MDLQVDGYMLLSVVNLEMLAVELGAWTLIWWGQEDSSGPPVRQTVTLDAGFIVIFLLLFLLFCVCGIFTG